MDSCNVLFSKTTWNPNWSKMVPTVVDTTHMSYAASSGLLGAVKMLVATRSPSGPRAELLPGVSPLFCIHLPQIPDYWHLLPRAPATEGRKSFRIGEKRVTGNAIGSFKQSNKKKEPKKEDMSVQGWTEKMWWEREGRKNDSLHKTLEEKSVQCYTCCFLQLFLETVSALNC